MQGIARRYAIGPAMYLICLAVTWWSVPLSLAMNGGMALFFLLSPDRSLKVKAVPR